MFIVGGANSAGQAAVYFAQYANRVTILYRGDDLGKSMSRYLVDQIAPDPQHRRCAWARSWWRPTARSPWRR